MASADGLRALGGEHGRLALVGALLVAGTYWVYYRHVVLGAEIVAPALAVLGLPIILASFWWRRYGLVVAAYLVVLSLSSHLIFLSDVPLVDDVVRAVMLVVVGIVVAILSEGVEKREKEIKRSEEFNRTLVQASPAFFVAIRPEGRTLMMNESMLTSLGYRLDEVVGTDYLSTFVPEGEREQVAAIFKRIVAREEPTLSENHVLTKEGDELLVEWHGRPIFKQNGGLDYFFGAGIDITERKAAETKIKHLNRVLRAIRGINQLIIGGRDRNALIHGVCELLTKSRDYSLAWIVLMDEKRVLAGAQKGAGDAFQSVLEGLKRGELPPCAKRSLEEAGAVVITDPSTCEGCPLSSTYAEDEGAMTVRLEYEKKLYGLMTVHLPLIFIDEEERALFEEVAGDIGFGLHNMELEEMKRRAYDQLETNIEIFATLVDGIRNPLAVISGYAELAGDERGRKILNQCERINKIIKQFDEGWLESEKVRDFLRRHV